MQRLSARGLKENNILKKCHFFDGQDILVKKGVFGGFILEKVALGKRIRESRINKGYTQQDLADRAEIGVVYISEIERGIKMPSLNSFIKIINALDVSADYVLRDELPSGKKHIFDELTHKLENLTLKQRKGAAAILDAYVCNLD